ncbi:hypothetical protein KR222_004240 [Zaprionus bogoriensis]|nr:hypothetical protein KR222_004240 [Zaprionus bogoriensis]
MEEGPGNNVSWAAGKKKVLCVGIVDFDCISEMRKFPKASNKPARSLKGTFSRGGHAANISVVLRNLGADVELFAVLSTVSMFRLVLDDLRKRGISTENCPRSSSRPYFSTVILTKSPKTCTIVNCSSAFPYVSVEDFQKLDLNLYGWIHFRCRHVHITIEMMKAVEAHNAAHEDKIKISMDFDQSLKTNWPLVDYCDYVFFSWRLSLENSWKTPFEASTNIDQLLNLRYGSNLKRPLIIIIWKFKGGSILDQKGMFFQPPSYKPTKVVDILGAGEAFIGAFIYAIYSRNRSKEIALDFANRMSSHKCTDRGFDHLVNILNEPSM